MAVSLSYVTRVKNMVLYLRLIHSLHRSGFLMLPAATQRARRGFEVKQDQGRRGMIWLWPDSGHHVLEPSEGIGRAGELPGGENARHQGAREEGAAEALRRDKVLQTCTKAGGGVRDHGGGVGTALLRYLQLNVGKTNFGTFLA